MSGLEWLKRACPRVANSGSGLLVAPDLVATCDHVVPGLPLGAAVQVTFLGEAPRTARLWQRDAEADLVLLKLDEEVRDVAPLPLGEGAARGERFLSWVYPEANSGGLLVDGEVHDPSGRHGEWPALVVYSKLAAAGAGGPLKGVSGGAVVVAGRVVGYFKRMIRVLDERPLEPGEPEPLPRAELGLLYAYPIEALLRLHPALRAAAAPSSSRSAPPRPDGAYNVGWYVRRPQLEEQIFEHLNQPGMPAFLIGPYGTGKTWLQWHVLRNASVRLGVPVVPVYLNLLEASRAQRQSADALFRFLATTVSDRVAEARGIEPEVAEGWVSRFWRGDYSPAQRFGRVLQHSVFGGGAPDDALLLLAIDHIDLIDDEELRGDLLGVVRAKAIEAPGPPWSRLRVLLGAATSFLVDPRKGSPLPMARCEIAVSGLDGGELDDMFLAAGKPLAAEDRDQALRLLGGNPRLCHILADGVAHSGLPPGEWLARHGERAFQRDLDEYLGPPFHRDPQLQSLLCDVLCNPQIRRATEEHFRLLRTGLIDYDNARRSYVLLYQLFDRPLRERCGKGGGPR